MDMHVDWGALLKLVAVVAVVALILAAIVLAWPSGRSAASASASRRTRTSSPPYARCRSRWSSASTSSTSALDVFSAPIIWFILNRFGLQALRNVATVEALIPISGPIPTLTLAWLAARIFNLGEPHDPDLIETRRIGPDSYVPRPRDDVCG